MGPHSWEPKGWNSLTGQPSLDGRISGSKASIRSPGPPLWAKGQQRWESSGFRIQDPKEDRMWRRLRNGEEPPGGSRRGGGSLGIFSLTPAKDAPRSHPPRAWRRSRTSLLLDANRTGVGCLGCAERDGNLVSKGSIDSTPHRRCTDLRTSGPERVETGNENPHHPKCWNKRWASAENVFPEKEFRANSYVEKLSLWKDWGAGQCWTPLEGRAQEGLWGHRHLGFPFIDSPNVIFPINREH